MVTKSKEPTGLTKLPFKAGESLETWHRYVDVLPGQREQHKTVPGC